MKSFSQKAILGVLGLAMLAAGTAHASCEEAYAAKLEKLTNDHYVSLATGVATGTTVAAAVNPSAMGIGIPVGFSVTSSLTPNREEVTEMQAILRDTQLGGGLALASLMETLRTRQPDIKSSEVVESIKMANDRGILCMGEGLVMKNELSRIILAGLLKGLE